MQLNYVRLSFPDIFTPVEYKVGDGKPRYNATFLVDPGSDNDIRIEAEILRVATEVFGARAQQMIAEFRPQTNKFPYIDGNRVEYEGYAGKKALSAHVNTKPNDVVSMRPNAFMPDGTKLTAADGKIYGGCYVDAIVSIYAQEAPNPGIRCSFTGIRFRADGPSLGGASPASVDDFSQLTPAEIAEANAAPAAPTAGNFAAAPAPTVAPPPVPVAPAPAFMQPPLPAAHVPKPEMTAKAAGATYEAFKANPAWTDELMIAQGYMVMR